jgi:RNA recognition motif-containing protein
MSRSSQTQQKRQRENKLREKAQLKRERRQQRQAEKKVSQVQGDKPAGDQLLPSEIQPREDALAGFNPESHGIHILYTLERDQAPEGSAANQAEYEAKPQNGGAMSSRLFAGNLPRNVTDADLTDFVSNAGFQVTSAQVIRDRMTGETKGFGFIELAEGADVANAIATLNGRTLNDRRVTVNEARPQSSGSSGSRGGSDYAGRARGGFGGKRKF